MALLEGGWMVEEGGAYASDAVGDGGDVHECVGKGRYDEGVVVGEWTCRRQSGRSLDESLSILP